MEITIPDNVLAKIENHRPHMATMINNLKEAKNPDMARVLERRIADAYLAGETRLTALETFKLAACCHGREYGQ